MSQLHDGDTQEVTRSGFHADIQLDSRVAEWDQPISARVVVTARQGRVESFRLFVALVPSGMIGNAPAGMDGAYSVTRGSGLISGESFEHDFQFRFQGARPLDEIVHVWAWCTAEGDILPFARMSRGLRLVPSDPYIEIVLRLTRPLRMQVGQWGVGLDGSGVTISLFPGEGSPEGMVGGNILIERFSTGWSGRIALQQAPRSRAERFLRGSGPTTTWTFRMRDTSPASLDAALDPLISAMLAKCGPGHDLPSPGSGGADGRSLPRAGDPGKR